MDASSSGGNIATELAKERNRAAADRTLNSWIRTSLALIGFGFGISKIHASLEAMGVHGPSDPMRSTLLVGGSFGVTPSAKKTFPAVALPMCYIEADRVVVGIVGRHSTLSKRVGLAAWPMIIAAAPSSYLSA